ncbi:MAG: hypothetical protein ACLFOY_06640 [Desulfatibacillaceae bacterium]
MTKRYDPISLDDVRTTSLYDRKSKVGVADFGAPWKAGGTFADFLDRLPGILAADDLKAAVQATATAARERRPVLWGMGAHVIKVGLNPVVIDLMERGVITAVAMNGAGIIHDTELAMAGRTSEEVSDVLGAGDFGMARETSAFLGEAIRQAAAREMGLGEAVGRAVLDEGLPHAGQSILGAGARLGVPVTVHVAVGTDIIHMHPAFDPAAAGAASHRDFRIHASVVADLQDGVVYNVGSAVILPEVFLKALSLVRNLGHVVTRFTAVNMDFLRHYRPMTNVVSRPTAGGGRGIHLTGHHEIMVPLLAAGVIEFLEQGG